MKRIRPAPRHTPQGLTRVKRRLLPLQRRRKPSASVAKLCLVSPARLGRFSKRTATHQKTGSTFSESPPHLSHCTLSTQTQSLWQRSRFQFVSTPLVQIEPGTPVDMQLKKCTASRNGRQCPDQTCRKQPGRDQGKILPPYNEGSFPALRGTLHPATSHLPKAHSKCHPRAGRLSE